MEISASSTSLIPSRTANSIQVLMACDGLVRNGCKLTLTTPGRGAVPFDSLREPYGLTGQEFSVERVPSHPRLKRMDFILGALLKARHADLLYTWAIQIAALSVLQGRPTAFEAHDLPTGGGKRWFRIFAASRTKKRCLCITHALKERLLTLYPELDPADCVIQPNGFDPEAYHGLPDLKSAKADLSFDTERVIFSCSGHLYTGRGAELFLQLARRHPEADFRWFGGNPKDVEACRAAAADLPNVTFHGMISKARLPLYQAASDVLMMPYSSRIEGSSGGNSSEICSPMKLFEYIAAGRAILSADLPVIHEILDPSSAVFCAPDDIDAWSKGAERLLTNAVLRQDMGERVRALAPAYTWEARAHSFLEAWKD